VGNINKHINLIETEYNNTSNRLKNISIKRFMEHIVEDNGQLIEEIKPANNNLNSVNSNKIRENNNPTIILSKEERERNILNKFKSSITNSLENLNIKNLIDIKDNNNDNNISILDDDNVSISSSKYFNNSQKNKNLNIKLPFIIGTIDYFKNEYLGVSNPQSLIGNMINNSSYINNTNNEMYLNNQNQKFQNGKSIDNNKEFTYEIKKESLEKLSMNMNLIEQIYEKKNSYNPAVADEQKLNEILLKNMKNDYLLNNNNLFDSANKNLIEQIKDVYNNTDKNLVYIQDPKFVDFTKINHVNLNNNYFDKNFNNDMIVINNLENNFLFNEKKNSENILRDSKEPLIPNIVSKDDNIVPKKIYFNEGMENLLNNYNFQIPINKRVTLDNFVKKSNLFDNPDLFDNDDEDDNTGLFKNNKETKFNLLIKNTNKNTLFSDKQDNTEIKENTTEEIENFNSEANNIKESSTDKRLGDILKIIDESVEDIIIKNEKKEIEIKTIKSKNTLTMNLFSESILDKEENNNIIKTNNKKEENNINNLNKESNEKENISDVYFLNTKAEKKSSLLSIFCFYNLKY